MEPDRGDRTLFAAQTAQHVLTDEAGAADDGLECPGSPGAAAQDPREGAATAGIDTLPAEAAFTTAEVYAWAARGVAREQPARAILDALPAARAQRREQILGNRPGWPR